MSVGFGYESNDKLLMELIFTSLRTDIVNVSIFSYQLMHL